MKFRWFVGSPGSTTTTESGLMVGIKHGSGRGRPQDFFQGGGAIPEAIVSGWRHICLRFQRIVESVISDFYFPEPPETLIHMATHIACLNCTQNVSECVCVSVCVCVCV